MSGQERATESTIEGLVDGTSLHGASRWWLRPFADLPILVVDLGGRDVFTTWQEVQGLLDASGWSAVCSVEWGSTAPEDTEALLQTRDEFEWAHHEGAGPAPRSFDPDDLLAAAPAWTDEQIDARLDELERERDEEMDAWPVDERVALELEVSSDVSGAAPDPADIPSEVRSSPSVLDRWLLDWELEHADPPRDQVQPWFDPDRLHEPTRLWLIPRDEPFAAVAVQHWWQADLPFELAVFQRWQRRWGAQLVAHWGTMLQVVAARLPETVDDAHALAREQHLLCDALLEPAGEARRHLALGLMHVPRWFLHSRP